MQLPCRAVLGRARVGSRLDSDIDLWRDLYQISIHEDGAAGCEEISFEIAQHPLIDQMNKRSMRQRKSAHAFQ